MLVGYRPQFYGNDTLLFDEMLRYATRFTLVGKNTRLELQLNARNLLDNQERQLRRTTDNPNEVLRWNFQTPCELILSVTFKL